MTPGKMHRSRKATPSWVAYHIARAKEIVVVADNTFTPDEGFALSALAINPEAATAQTWIMDIFRESYSRDPDTVLRWIQAVRDEDQRLRESNPVRHHLLHCPETRSAALSDDQHADEVSLHYGDPCDAHQVKRERARIREIAFGP